MTENRLKELFDDAVLASPPATFDLEQAVRAGNRRRRTRNGLSVVAGAAVVAVAVGGVVSLTTRAPHDSVAGPAATTSPGQVAAQPSAPPTPVPPTVAQLTAAALHVAGPHGKVVSSDDTTDQGGTLNRDVRVHVTTKDGGYDVAAGITNDAGNGVATWSQSCTLDNGGAQDGKPCTPILRSADRGIWSRTYTDQPGRESIMLATTLPDGSTLTIVVDNYTEQPDGSKATGPSWKNAGITAADLNAAADALSR